MENTKTLMAQFYSQCQENGYTDMDDAKQSLKAKMIAMELKLDYGDIVAFYQEAQHCYEQVAAEQKRLEEEQRIQQQKEAEEAARRAVDGKLLATLYETKTGRNSKTPVAVYQRPDGSIYYTIRNGDRIEGVPEISVHKGGTLQYTYHPSQAVYTGATGGSVTIGGVHHTEASYSERVNSSDKGYFCVKGQDTSFTVFLVELSDYTCSRFARDALFARYVENKKMFCYDTSAGSSVLLGASSTISPSTDYHKWMSMASMEVDKQRLPFSTSAAQAELVGKIIHAQFPPTDEEYYNKAAELAKKETSAELKQAVDLFMFIRDFRDAAEQAVYANERYQEFLQKEEKERASRTKKIAMIVGPVVAVGIIGIILALLISNVFIPNSKYNKAIALMDAGQYEDAIAVFEELDGYKDSRQIIADYKYNAALARMDAGQYKDAIVLFSEVGDRKDTKDYLAECLNVVAKKQTTVAADYLHTVGLKADGTVVAVGENDEGQCDVSDWTDIVAVDTGEYHTVGLKADGTVVAVGDNSKGQCDVSDWSDIIAVAAGFDYTVGLKADGTVVAVGDIYDVSGWTGIVAVAAGTSYIVGLKDDGTVVAVGYNDCGQCDVSNWTGVVAVAATTFYTVGLKADGTVVAVGHNGSGECDVSGWADIVAVDTGYNHTVGLKADGTVVAVGDNSEGKCDVGDWTDIVAVAAGNHHTVGLKADGTVVAVGDIYDVSSWTDIKVPEN